MPHLCPTVLSICCGDMLLLVSFSAASSAFFLQKLIYILICCVFSRYIFFKLQDSVFLLLPSDNEFYLDVGNEYYFLMLSFWGLFVCQTLYLTHRIVEQCRSTILLVDWERPKGRLNNQVSTWRKVLVANEFLSMQTSRKHSIAFNLALIGFFVTLDDSSHGTNANIALRFASTCFFWCSASIIQWLWRFLFYERWCTEPRGQRFVDLCSVSNISVFILTEQHKGNYIHGRSPYQHSDCSMEELLESFRKEVSCMSDVVVIADFSTLILTSYVDLQHLVQRFHSEQRLGCCITRRASFYFLLQLCISQPDQQDLQLHRATGGRRYRQPHWNS